MREKREITNISEMFLFLLTYGLLLSSSFFSHFISCSVTGLPERASRLASPLVSPLQASCWQEASAGGQLSVFSEQAGPCRGSVVLGQCDGRSEMDVPASAGCHHKTSPNLTRSFPLFIAFLWGREGMPLLQSHKGVL